MSHGKLLLHGMKVVLPSAGLAALISCLVSAELANTPLPFLFAGHVSGRGRRGSWSAVVPLHSPVCAVLGRGGWRGQRAQCSKGTSLGLTAFFAGVQGFDPGRIFFFHLTSLERIQSSKVLHL